MELFIILKNSLNCKIILYILKFLKITLISYFLFPNSQLTHPAKSG